MNNGYHRRIDYLDVIVGGAAAWAWWAMAHPKFWSGGPQCIWRFGPTNNLPVCSLFLQYGH